jgi:putative SOS response-associated peptidase YedK
MCGRFTLTRPDQDLAVQFSLPGVPEIKPRYNIAPTQPVAAVRLDPTSLNRELVFLTWGLVPFWAKDPKIGSRMINARSETVATKPAFRAAFRRRRCLVVADGFFEWQRIEGGKQPYWICLREGGPFAFAGLWERWEGAEGSEIESCTLLTTQPNELLRDIHNRMPVILDPGDYDLWLDPAIQKVEPLEPLFRPFPSELLRTVPVGRFVNSPRNEGPLCIEAVPYGETQSLPGF